MDLLLLILLIIVIAVLWPLIKAYALFLIVLAALYLVFRNNGRRL